MSDHADYIEYEFGKLGGSDYLYKIKVLSPDDATKWISISPATAEKIKRILIEDERKG